MFHLPRRATSLVIASLMVIGLSASPARAKAPLKEGPFHFSGSFTDNACGFDAMIEFDVTETFTIFLDDAGDVAKAIYRVRAPHDVFTNLETGESFVVRGMFQEFIERIPGTDEFTKEIVGFRYLVNEPGVGVTIRDVGRIVYGDLDQTIVLRQAGKHDLAYWEAYESVFCEHIRR
jgi:hypothetical protein